MKNNCTHVSIIAFLSVLRTLHPELENKCLRGSCFKLYLLLKEIWTDAEAWYDSDHVITKIDDKFYDIRGEVVPMGHLRMKDEPRIFNNAYYWDEGAAPMKIIMNRSFTTKRKKNEYNKS